MNALGSTASLALSGRFGRRHGRVASWNQEKGFGFVVPAGGGADVFVRFREVLNHDEDHLPIGTRVEYDLEDGVKGPRVRRVDDLAAAVEKLDRYALRWRIDTFHKVLKSGCRAEQAKLQTAERLASLLAVLCVVGWRVFWLTTASRVTPDAAPETAFTTAEIAVLDRVSGGPPEATKRTVSHYLLSVAKLGGYLARKKDPPPGNTVVWRCLTRLADLGLGYELRGKVVGN